jgi:hypothetical protein
VWDGGEIYADPEIDQGFGLSNTLGVAGFPSGEAYKVGKVDPYFRIIETTGVFLLTFFPNGFVGENWFPDIDSAKAQAARNTSGFPGGIGPWMLIPPEVADLWEFGKGLLGETN